MSVQFRVVAPFQRGPATYTPGEVLTMTVEESKFYEGFLERVEEPKKKD